MDRNDADRLVADLGRKLGLPDLALDEAGTCILATEDGTMIPTLGHNAGAGSIDLMLCLDEVVPGPAQLGGLMAGNFGWPGGLCFATEPASGALVVQRRCSAHDLAEGLLPVLTGLVGAARAVAERLAQQASEMGVPAAVRQTSFQGMIRA